MSYDILKFYCLNFIIKIVKLHLWIGGSGQADIEVISSKLDTNTESTYDEYLENLLKKVLPPDNINGLEANKVNSEIWQQQPWESAAAFSNAVVNAVLC